jgi:CheY-like chemotaxis protein
MGANPVTGRKILIVDDDWMVQLAARRLFEALGARVTTAAGTAQASELLARERPDVMVLDLGVAGADAGPFVERARRAVPDLGVVIFTGWPDSGLAAALGCEQIAKTSEPRALILAVARSLPRQPSGHASSARRPARQTPEGDDQKRPGGT